MTQGMSRVDELLRLPWHVESGIKPDGTRWARCVEMPHAVAYVDPDEDLDAAFWESMRASVSALLEFGEPIPRPAGPPLAFPRHLLVRWVPGASEVQATGPRSAAGGFTPQSPGAVALA